MLTRKQHELLLLIDERLKAEGIAPSFDEMRDALGLKSKSGIHRLIKGLAERGFIRRLPHRARALEVIRLPESETAARRPTASAAPPAALEPGVGLRSATILRPQFGDRRRPEPEPEEPNVMPVLPGRAFGLEVAAMQLPLYGRIAAGTPIEALRDQTNFVDVPASLLGPGDFYALEVAGDSMVEAGIHDGDVVIIRRGDTAENGAIVVALVDEQEVTLKRLRRYKDKIALEPANAKYETRVYGADRVQVQGRLHSLMRRY